MAFLSATDFAIRLATRRNALRLSTHVSRFGGTYVAISDDVGVIEVADDMAAAERRVAEAGGV